MKSRSRFLATSLIVFLTIGIFTAVGYSQHEKSDNAIEAIMEGANTMMDGNKTIMDVMTKKGMKDAELTSADKKMTDGYNMIIKGRSMMTGNTMAEGKEMVIGGSKMMLEAKKTVDSAVEKKGMTQECATALSQCETGEKQIERGLQRNLPGGQQ
jgi:hypothetical protein